MPYIIETWDKPDSKADPFNKAELFDRVTITRVRKAYVEGRSYL